MLFIYFFFAQGLIPNRIRRLAQVEAAISEDFCHCIPGFYLSKDDHRCYECTEGASCPGSSEVEIEPGYFSFAADPGSIYKCYSGSAGDIGTVGTHDLFLGIELSVKLSFQHLFFFGMKKQHNLLGVLFRCLPSAISKLKTCIAISWVRLSCHRILRTDAYGSCFYCYLKVRPMSCRAPRKLLSLSWRCSWHLRSWSRKHQRGLQRVHGWAASDGHRL